VAKVTADFLSSFILETVKALPDRGIFGKVEMSAG
jgi:hypothetical protein